MLTPCPVATVPCFPPPLHGKRFKLGRGINEAFNTVVTDFSSLPSQNLPPGPDSMNMYNLHPAACTLTRATSPDNTIKTRQSSEINKQKIEIPTLHRHNCPPTLFLQLSPTETQLFPLPNHGNHCPTVCRQPIRAQSFQFSQSVLETNREIFNNIAPSVYKQPGFYPNQLSSSRDYQEYSPHNVVPVVESFKETLNLQRQKVSRGSGHGRRENRHD